jgi:hypothetical protein
MLTFLEYTVGDCHWLKKSYEKSTALKNLETIEEYKEGNRKK